MFKIELPGEHLRPIIFYDVRSGFKPNSSIDKPIWVSSTKVLGLKLQDMTVFPT